MTEPKRRGTIGVQAVILRNEHLLVVVKQYPEGVAHILPGGSQEHGETLAAAIVRECHEELGAVVTVERLVFVREYIGVNHEHAALDSHVHVTNILFACTVPESYQPQLGPAPDHDQIGVMWLPLATAGQVRFYPKALLPYLTNPLPAAAYLGDIN